MGFWSHSKYMLKLIGIVFAVFVFGAVLYAVHVPVLKYWTTPSANSELTAYVPLSDRIDGETPVSYTHLTLPTKA